MNSVDEEVTISLHKLHDAQQKVIDESKRFNVLQCGRRLGKTTLGLDLIINTAIDGYPAAWFAPSYKLLSDVWREAVRIVQPAMPTISQQEKRIELPTGGVMEFWSLDQPDAARGRKYKRIVIDEAGIVRELEQAWQQALRPTLADLKGDAWFLGTPKGKRYFHQLYAKGQSGDADWASWRMPTIANPFIDPAEVEAARRDMPPSAFNQEFLGIPADDGGNPFGLDSIRACAESHPADPQGPIIAIGVDLAKSHDWTVACGLNEQGNVCRLERWQTDWGQTRRRVLDLIGNVPTLVDATGVGDPLVEDFYRAPGTRVEGFKFTAPSKQQLMEGLAAAIQRKEITFPPGWLTNELEAFEYEYRPGGGVRYQAPEGLFDDGVCALALAVRKWSETRYRRVSYGESFVYVSG